MIKRAEKAGCTAVAVTVDRTGGRNQETLFRLRPLRHPQVQRLPRPHQPRGQQQNPADVSRASTCPGCTNIQSSAMTWDFFKRLRDLTKMKVVVKGILACEDAMLAADAGLDAIIVSNHGARSEDSGRSTIDALPEIVEAVNGRMPILVDSGFRRGTDIFKALCMGATAVSVGRPVHLGPRRLWPARRRARARTAAHRDLSASCSRSAHPTSRRSRPAMVRRA